MATANATKTDTAPPAADLNQGYFTATTIDLSGITGPAQVPGSELRGHIAAGEKALASARIDPAAVVFPSIPKAFHQAQEQVIEERKAALGVLASLHERASQAFGALCSLASDVLAAGRAIAEDIPSAAGIVDGLRGILADAQQALKNDALNGMPGTVSVQVEEGYKALQVTGRNISAAIEAMAQPQPKVDIPAFSPGQMVVDLSQYDKLGIARPALSGLKAQRLDPETFKARLNEEIGEQVERLVQAREPKTAADSAQGEKAAALATAQAAKAQADEALSKFTYAQYVAEQGVFKGVVLGLGVVGYGIGLWRRSAAAGTAGKAVAAAEAEAIKARTTAREAANSVSEVYREVRQHIFEKCDGLQFLRDRTDQTPALQMLERCAVPLSKQNADLSAGAFHAGIAAIQGASPQGVTINVNQANGAVLIERSGPRDRKFVFQFTPTENGRVLMEREIRAGDGRAVRQLDPVELYSDDALENARIIAARAGQLKVDRPEREVMVVRNIQ